jgi:ABC-type sugar transport system substrate-binding protein
MATRKVIRFASAAAGAAALMLVFTGCTPSPESSTSSSASQTEDSSGQVDQAQIDDFLLAPSDATVYEATTAETAVTGPLSDSPVYLPYNHVLPLPDGPVGDPNKIYTVCFSQALTGSTWAVEQQESAMIEAARHPNVKVLFYNTPNDPLKQVADVDSCLAQKVDAVVIWPHSVEPLTPSIEKIKESGTVIVGMERTVATRDYDSWVYLDNAQATRDLAIAVGEKLGGEGIVVEVDGAIGSSPQILRRAGFADALKELYPNITIEYTAPTDYSRGEGYKVTLDYLQANPSKKIGAFYSQYTETGFGVAQALADYEKTDIPQYSIVDGRAAVQGVLDGTFEAVAPWTPLHGDVGLRAALYHLTGKDVSKNILLQQPPLITKENAQDQLQRTWPG